METYFTIEEKYLQAVEEIRSGETPKGLQILNQIIANDPLYARAHFQLGIIHYYDMKDYQTAGYHFKTCIELEPSFPDVYYHYMNLLVFLKMEKQAEHIKTKALNTPGVNAASIYNFSGLLAEKTKRWSDALKEYENAFLEVTNKDEKEHIWENIERVKAKMQKKVAYKYHYHISN
jgi:tetratricopeptide (TPR) repeat protein